MRLFNPIYKAAIRWASMPRAPLILAVWSVIEATFFLPPPELILTPMCLAQPKKGFRFASISLLGALAGAFIAYAIGHFASVWVEEHMVAWGYGDVFRELKHGAATNGFWLLVMAGFVPIPLKIFTLASGVVGMPLLPFVAGILVGRGKRVFLVAGAIYMGGEKLVYKIEKNIERIGILICVLVVAVIGWLWWKA
jgi:membrane protein YqaA with SNARE-associated domain